MDLHSELCNDTVGGIKCFAPKKLLKEDSPSPSRIPVIEKRFGNIITFRLTLTLYIAESTLKALIGTVT